MCILGLTCSSIPQSPAEDQLASLPRAGPVLMCPADILYVSLPHRDWELPGEEDVTVT